MYRPMSVIWAELPEINMMDGWIGWYMHAVMLHECPCDDVACMVWHCLVTAWTDLQTVTCLSVWCNRWQVHILSSWSNLETNIRASWGNPFFPLLPNCELDICIHIVNVWVELLCPRPVGGGGIKRSSTSVVRPSVSVCLMSRTSALTRKPKGQDETLHRGTPGHMRLPHRLQDQKVKSQGHGVN